MAVQFGFGAALCLSGCSTGPETMTPILRPGHDLPAHFTAHSPGAGETAEGCRNPLIDPRDGTELRLVRSSDRAGDYAPPAGRYGVKPGELLRVDCATGEALGVVRR